jgi:hypothetical protein
MVGQATNSTAFPHGNRNIQVYEWTNGTSGASAYAAPTQIAATSGNIWMYRANMMSTKGNIASLVDPTWTVQQSAVGDGGIITDGACLKCHVPADAQSAAAYGLPDGSFEVTATPRIGAGHHGGKDAYLPSAWINGLTTDNINPYSGELLDDTLAPASGSEGNRLLYLWR